MNPTASTLQSAPAARPTRPRPPRQVALERTAATLFRRGESVFAGLALFLFAQALVPVLLDQSGMDVDVAEGNIVLRLMFASIHALTLLLAAVHWRRMAAAALNHPAATLLVVLAFASAGWSADPDLTVRRSLSFLGTTLFGLYFAARFDVRTQLRLLGWAFGAMAALSLVFGLFLPRYGLDHGAHAGKWQGIFTAKNMLGQTMALGALVFLMLRRAPAVRRGAAVAGLLLCVLLVLLSTSKTALGVMLAAMMLSVLFRRWHGDLRLALAVTAGFILAAGTSTVWFLTNAAQLLISLGKDPSLTGRTPMWNVLAERVAQQPVVGYGYSGFWLGNREPSLSALREIGWSTPNAHNGYLDLLLQFGLVGALLVAAATGLAIARGLSTLRATGSVAGQWPAVFLCFLLLYNFTETALVQSNQLLWVLWVAATAPWVTAARDTAEPSRVRGRATVEEEGGATLSMRPAAAGVEP